MEKRLINIKKSNNVKGASKAPLKPDGNFSRRPPHTPPKGNNSNPRGGK